MNRRVFLRSSAIAAGTAVAQTAVRPASAREGRVVIPTHPATAYPPRAAYPALAPLGASVFEARLERARELMRASKFDVLFAMSGSTNFAYLVGGNFGRSERPIALVLPVDGAPVIVAPSFETERVRRGARIGTVRGWEEHEDPFVHIREAFGPARPNRTVLVEPKTDYWAAMRLLRAVPDAQLADGSAAFETFRITKTDEELARIRHAILITEDAISATFDRLEIGMRDADVRRVLRDEHTKRGGVGDGLVQFGPQSALPHGGTTNATLRAETVVLIDAGCEYQGYQSDITRTRWVGESVPRKFRDIYNLVHDAQSAAIQRVRPGVACQEIDRAARALIARAGFGNFFTHRLGHGMGMDGHEPAYMVEGNARPLEPGFVFSVEPGVYLPNEYGVRIEDDVACTAGGSDVLSRRAPRL
jgi:Xaa-Pro dipeptidase